MRKEERDGQMVIQRRYTPGELRDLMRFCQENFDQFVRLLIWLDRLPNKG